MVTIAVIDDGIENVFFNIDKISNNIEITHDLEIQNRCISNNISHGTICAAIIKKYYPEAMLTSIKILDKKSHRCKKNQLIKAIQWCIENDIKVINLSIGTIDYRDFESIRKIINKAYNEGIVIVAACNNRNIFTYPASCINVIGVKCCEDNSLKEGEYIYNLYPIDGIEIVSCSEHKLLKNNLELELTHKCNSYATPMITAKICNIIDEYPDISLDAMKEKLYENSVNYIKGTVGVNNFINIEWIDNAALLIDSTQVFSEVSLTNEIKVFKEKDNINVKQFNTLILMNCSMDDYKRMQYIIEQFRQMRKNIIMIYTEYNDIFNGFNWCIDNTKFWSPSIIKNFYDGCLPRKKINIPLIIIYGYPEYEFIKLLKELTDYFRNDGYYAAGICTNPVSILYMLEYIPVSDKNDYLTIKDKIEVLYRVYDYDIIILGISIFEQNIDKIKEINISLKPDKTIFFMNNFTCKKNKFIKYVDNDLILLTRDNIEKYSSLGYEVFEYKDLNLFYKYILNVFLCER